MEIDIKKIVNALTERKTNECAIAFDENPAKVYYSGQLISGTIQLTLREQKKLQGVSAKVIGVAFVFYEGNGQSNTEFRVKDNFFEKRIELVLESGGKK